MANIGVEIREDKFLLNSLTRACKIHNDHIELKFPIHKRMMMSLVRKVGAFFRKQNQEYLACLYQAFFITAYYGLFRVGELTENEGGHAIAARDVHIATNKNKILFILRSSKMHNKGDFSQTVTISGVTGSDCCPFKILGKYLSMRPTRKNNLEQFFVFRSRMPVMAAHFRSTLKKVMKLAGYKKRRHILRSHSVPEGQETSSKQVYQWKLLRNWGGGSQMRFTPTLEHRTKSKHVEMAHRLSILSLTGPITAVRECWLLGDDFFRSLFGSLAAIRMQARVNDRPQPYIYRYFDVKALHKTLIGKQTADWPEFKTLW